MKARAVNVDSPPLKVFTSRPVAVILMRPSVGSCSFSSPSYNSYSRFRASLLSYELLKP